MVDKMLDQVLHHFRVGLLCVLSMAIGADSKMKNYTMLEHCGYTIEVPPQGMGLSLTKNGATYPPDTDCSIALQVATGKQIMLQFEQVNINSYSLDKTTIHCVDWLTVIDGDPSWGYPIVPGMANRVCGHGALTTRDKQSFSSTGHFLTLIFKSANKKTYFTSTGFSVIVKPYHTGTCQGAELLCSQNHRCIDFGLACNRQLYDPCGNGGYRPSDCYGFTSSTVAPADRNGSTDDYHKGVATLVGISVGGGILLLLLVVIVVVYKYMRKRTCGGSGRRVISRSTRRAFRSRGLNSGSATGLPDCILATVTCASQPPPYSAICGDGEQNRESPYPDEPPPPYTEI